MNIFRLFESKKFMKICSKTHQIARFKKFFRGSIPPNPPPPSKRLASPPPKSWPSLGKACIRPWITTEKFI